ncbi:MAG TPA: hypothetical protein VEV21_00650 [Burkholderiales bacterium]|nr:hypothetical protein [Burkholderiales bacterium]
MLDIAMHQPREPEARDEDDRALEGFKDRDGAQAGAFSGASGRRKRKAPNR